MATGSGGAMAAMQHKGMQHMATQSAGANQVLSEREVQRITAAGPRAFGYDFDFVPIEERAP